MSMGSFLVFALPLTWIAYKQPASLERYRIQQHRRARPEKMLWPSVRKWLSNNLILTALILLVWPLLRLTSIHAGELPPWWEIAWQIAFFIVLDDFLYYWMHRAFHTETLYKRVHSVHHRMTTPWAISGHYMHPVEFVATTALMLVGPLIVGAHVMTIWLWVAFRQWEAAEGHCGYQLPWIPVHVLPFYDGAGYHDFHHAKFFGNYGGFLHWTDGVFGEYSEGWLAWREEARRR